MIALRNFNRSCNGYRFLYKDVWERGGNVKLNKKTLLNEIKKICILDENFNNIKICASKADARKFLNILSTNNCVGKLKNGEIRNVSRGDKNICYLEDYIKYENGEYVIYKPNISKNKTIYFVPKNIVDKEQYCFTKKYKS